MKILIPFLLLSGLMSALAEAPDFQSTDWPAWRGLHGDGHAKAVKGLPLKWNDSKNNG